jgi:hypothetical protein
MTFFWDVAPCSLVDTLIALMMEAVSISETSVNFYQTIRRNIPEDSCLHTRRRENLRSQDKKCLRKLMLHFNFMYCMEKGGGTEDRRKP